MSKLTSDKNRFIPHKVRVFTDGEQGDKKALVAREGVGCEANLKKIENDPYSKAPRPWESRDNVPTTGWKLFGEGISGGNYPSAILILKGPDDLVHRAHAGNLLNSIIKFGILPGGELSFPLIYGWRDGGLTLESAHDQSRMSDYMTEDERDKILKKEQKQNREELKARRAGEIPSVGTQVYLAQNPYEKFIYIGKVSDGKNKWHAMVTMSGQTFNFSKSRDSILHNFSKNPGHELIHGQLYKDFPTFERKDDLAIHESFTVNDVAQLMFELCESWHIRNESVPKWMLGQRNRDNSYSYTTSKSNADIRVWYAINKNNRSKYQKTQIDKSNDTPLMMHPLTFITENPNDGTGAND